MITLPDFMTDLAAGDWLNFSLKGVFIYFFILWVAVVVWVARDVVGRTRNLPFQVSAIALTIILNIFGLLIYLIIRPQKTLLEHYYEEIEQKTLTENQEVCPHCERPLPLEFRYCPTCSAEARLPCGKCKKLMSNDWATCAYCGAERSSTKKINLAAHTKTKTAKK